MRQIIAALLAPLLVAAQPPTTALPHSAGQRQSQEPARPQATTPPDAKAKDGTRPKPDADGDAGSKQRLQAQEANKLTAVNLLAREIQRAAFYRRASYAARVLTEAADALWPYRDHVAEKALRDAWARTNRDLDDESNAEAKARGSAERERVIGAHELRTELRSEIIAVAQRRKPELVKEFLDTIEEKEEDARAAHELPIAFGTGSLRRQQLASAALRLAPTDPARAVALASASLDYGMPQELQGLFRELAASSPAHARELFRKGVAVFSADQSVNIYDAIFLAAYLKFSREPEPDVALVRTFLDAALERMLRLRARQLATGDRGEGQRSAMLMSLSNLQPYFQLYHPERLNELTVLGQQLRPELPAGQFESDGANLTSSDNPNAPENILSRAASEKNAGLREELYLQAALKFAQEKKFDRALDAALSAREGGRREPFVTFIRFQHARHSAAEGELDEGAKLLEKIDDPELRSDATVALVTAARKARDTVLARYALDQTVKSLGNQAGSAAHARAQLWLASAYALLDADRGFELMQAGVRAANSATQLQDLRAERRILRVNEAVREVVVTGGSGAGDFRPGFGALARADFQRTVQLAESFTNQLFRGLAVVAAAASVLKEKPKTRKSDAPAKPGG